jgi:hypothetical protein
VRTPAGESLTTSTAAAMGGHHASQPASQPAQPCPCAAMSCLATRLHSRTRPIWTATFSGVEAPKGLDRSDPQSTLWAKIYRFTPYIAAYRPLNMVIWSPASSRAEHPSSPSSPYQSWSDRRRHALSPHFMSPLRLAVQAAAAFLVLHCQVVVAISTCSVSIQIPGGECCWLTTGRLAQDSELATCWLASFDQRSRYGGTVPLTCRCAMPPFCGQGRRPCCSHMAILHRPERHRIRGEKITRIILRRIRVRHRLKCRTFSSSSRTTAKHLHAAWKRIITLRGCFQNSIYCVTAFRLMKDSMLMLKPIFPRVTLRPTCRSERSPLS